MNNGLLIIMNKELKLSNIFKAVNGFLYEMFYKWKETGEKELLIILLNCDHNRLLLFFSVHKLE